MTDIRSEMNKPLDLKEWAYSTIKQMIFNSEFDVNEQIRIEHLCDKLNVSRTPIREALLRLQVEGLVRAASRVGFFVVGLTKQDLVDIFELRQLIEGYAAEKAASIISEIDLSQLAEFQRRSVRAVKEKKPDIFIEMEIALHTMIINNANNRWLLRMHDSIKELVHRERILSLQSDENIRVTLTEHNKIIQALQAHDSNAAGNAMRDHIKAVQARLLDFLELPEK